MLFRSQTTQQMQRRSRLVTACWRLEAVARSIFALSNVEAASHTFNHPHDYAGGTAPGDAGRAAEARRTG